MSWLHGYIYQQAKLKVEEDKMIGSECHNLTCGRCPGCKGMIRDSLSSLNQHTPKTGDTLGFKTVHEETQISVPKIYETVYVMALKELMSSNMERLSSLAIQHEIIRIAESIAKLSADKFLQQREK